MKHRKIAYRLAEARRARERDTAFAALIETPHAFDAIAAGETTATTFAMPAPGRLAMSFSVALDPEDITITMSGQSMKFSCPALSADQLHRGSLGEKNATVSVTRAAGCPAGTLTLYALNALSVPKIIATAVFTA